MRVGKLITAATLVWASTVAYAVTAADEHGQGTDFVTNGTVFPNPDGASRTINATGIVDLTGPFFQSLGTNGRSCGTCHQPSDSMSVSAPHIQERFNNTNGLDPIFRPVDGSNCNHDVNVSTFDDSTVDKRRNAYSLLRTRGLIRIGIDVPAGADFEVVEVNNQYGCVEKTTISMYRRPLPSTNLRFLSAVMWDGRESTSATGTAKILYGNYPDALISNLLHQSLDATNGHAQGAGLRPTDVEKQQIVDFEMGLFTAQSTGTSTGLLNTQGASGGPRPLVKQPFFISINSSVDFLQASLGASPSDFVEPPGGLKKPGDGQFTSEIFNIFSAWARLPYGDPRASVARGQALFNSAPINIFDVAGINDDFGLPNVSGTCGTCHDTPNVGNHSFPTPLNIGVGDLHQSNSSVNTGRLDISYLPTIKACKKDQDTGLTDLNNCVTTTDLGQALIDGKFAHIGKLKGPILRGLSGRAPYFHNGSAQTLLEVVRFYEERFGVIFSPQDEADLVAFLSSL